MALETGGKAANVWPGHGRGGWHTATGRCLTIMDRLWVGYADRVDRHRGTKLGEEQGNRVVWCLVGGVNPNRARGQGLDRAVRGLWECNGTFVVAKCGTLWWYLHGEALGDSVVQCLGGGENPDRAWGQGSDRGVSAGQEIGRAHV